MILREALEVHKYLKKHVDGEVAGTYIISAANFGGGYYKDFIPDNGKRSPVSTSQHWYKHELLTYYGDEDGWESQS